ncbi:transposase [Streptomyces griseoviridis]|uniref:transposase n=1 Tax=Streptomyces griseoviridis TaxID=45398 RepID=UPI00344F8465
MVGGVPVANGLRFPSSLDGLRLLPALDQGRSLEHGPRPPSARGPPRDGHLPARGGHRPGLPVRQGVRHRRQGHPRLGRGGGKRHLLTETHGLPIDVMVTSAGLHDSKPARDLLTRARRPHPELAIVLSDSAYRGPFAEWARTELRLTVRTVSRSKDAKGFVVLPRRWVAERTRGWVMHARRLVRDHERLPESSEAMINLAAIRLMTRRLTRPPVYPTAARPRPGSLLTAA